MTAIYANSLSEITNLAANPPQHPPNASPRENKPLTLYIARVPGSKDVFLSPLKPREKVVTIEDIQSCLYFLHLDRPEDKILRERQIEAVGCNSSHSAPLPSHIRRKSLPTPSAMEDAQVRTTQTNLKPLRKPLPHVPLETGHLRATPTGSLRDAGSECGQTILQSSLADMKDHDHYSNRSHWLEKSAQASNKNMKENPPQRVLYPGHASHQAMNATFAKPEVDRLAYKLVGPEATLITTPKSVATRSSRNAMSLTLIRRDPGSGDQWNVARIWDLARCEAVSDNHHGKSNNEQSGQIYVEITNPGYKKFLRTEIEEPLFEQDNSFPQSRDYTPGLHEHDRILATSHIFQRRLWMEYARRSTHRRANSDSGAVVPGDEPVDGRRFAAVPEPDRRSSHGKGYTFLSPWNGRCEFATGVTGSSLKCKHTRPNHEFGASNVSQPSLISELRFNLPTPMNPKPVDVSSKISSLLSRPRAKSALSSSLIFESANVEDTGSSRSIEQLDLSLGQECAGGGVGGKRAKLGKLVIEGEGLQMLDLLVAANMSLWWRTYERVGVSGLVD